MHVCFPPLPGFSPVSVHPYCPLNIFPLSAAKDPVPRIPGRAPAHLREPRGCCVAAPPTRAAPSPVVRPFGHASAPLHILPPSPPPRWGRQGAPQLLWPPQARRPRPPACGFVSVELITPSHATCPSCPASQPAAICVFTLPRGTP